MWDLNEFNNMISFIATQVDYKVMYKPNILESTITKINIKFIFQLTCLEKRSQQKNNFISVN